MNSPLSQVISLFFRLGCTAFGGPAAHVAMMREEVVRKRGWLTDEEFLDALSATNFIPGPNSTELALHVGKKHAGYPGLFAAGAAFVLPAALIVSGAAWAYVEYGALPAAQSVLKGVKPVIIAVVLLALWQLGQAALKTRWLAGLAAAAVIASALGANELAVIAGAGAAAAFAASPKRAAFAGFPLLGLATPTSFSLTKLTLFFLKVGSVLFGSGYVLIAYLRGDLVNRFHWITESQLLDAVAVGQFTPGPLFTTATFIGYLLGGAKGAALATGAIFLPAFVFVAATSHLLPRLREWRLAGIILDGVNAGSVAVMAVTLAGLARDSILNVPAAAEAAVAALVLARLRCNSVWLVAGGALLGYLFG